MIKMVWCSNRLEGREEVKGRTDGIPGSGIWPAFSQFEQLMVKLSLADPATFPNFVRFKPTMFQEMGDSISKKNTN